MHRRGIAILAVICLAIAFGGCRSKSNPEYDEVLMPLQTGSVLHRRVQVKAEEEPKPKKKEKAPAPKPEAESSATPAPEEESTPPPGRFR